ncbi:FGGY carbohydrate kinase domain-containing protein [Ooceraea biroi]|uniref:FGGY carbohydrate kinase domain-containing protein n=1 Tax=Ooceraea biroi TaxID=2015173 RepID=A0A026VSI6_OOCBI|nr:FGGY carbohydrate kinase domain-containing protein [Ooceraea biroi]XP_026830666.1 FGGY carbohydrate kinase domain-containing protein [Ooceraea biroi]EZA46667.1 FGGY carbohydrate kinase domain-containing protein [Ooceraea biroi]
MDFFVGVDVGTGSARAALVAANGKVRKVAACPLEIFHPAPNFYEQSSDNIWSAVCHVVKSVVAGISAENVKGIGFDATCSLVALDNTGSPVTVSITGQEKQNVILWMDHRAQEEADFINSTGHDALQYVGGKVSLEMQTPKMLWLKKNLPASWSSAALLFDLPDFLTWKATESESRSLCSLVCKWNYTANLDGKNGWDESFFEQLNLRELKKDNWKKIGNDVRVPGDAIEPGLSAKAAAELGLLEGTPVGTSLIDAHAGGLGMIGCYAPDVSPNFSNRLALICGTSTCHMIVNEKKIFVNGVWGPYYNAMISGFWLNEGGQSATGKLLDHIIGTHPATPGIIMKHLTGNKHIQQYLSELLHVMAEQRNLQNVSYLTRDLHVWPDFHGNRSPLADPSLKGMVSGLSLSVDEEHLALLYLATVQALTYGTKYIIETLTAAGHNIEGILVCGGLSRNRLFIQTQADVLSLPVLCPVEQESVLVGAAILGACATKKYSMHETIKRMAGTANIVKPASDCYKYHLRKYHVFKKMVLDQQDYKKIMSEEL